MVGRGDGDIDAVSSGTVEPCCGGAITPFVGNQDSGVEDENGHCLVT